MHRNCGGQQFRQIDETGNKNEKASDVTTPESAIRRPKVSVIVPVYKVEPWLRECLDSLVNQTLKEIEIICIDDGSPDNCGKILDEYAAKDKRMIVIHQENKGVQEARNAGIAKATGEYIAFVDSDDYLQLNAYEVAYNSAKKDNADILQFQKRYLTETHIRNGVLPSEYYGKVTYNMLKQYKFNASGDHVWNKLFKSKLIKNDNKKFIKGITPADDTCFSYMLLGRAKNIKIIPAVLYNYRVRNESLARVSRDNFFINSYKMLKLICDDWRNHGLIKYRANLLLDLLVSWCSNFQIRFKYAKQILDSFGPDIYNPETVKKCDARTQQLIRELEDAAAHPEKYQSNPKSVPQKPAKKRRQSAPHNRPRKTRPNPEKAQPPPTAKNAN